MKQKIQIALATMVVALMGVVPAYAYAGHKSGTNRSHAQTYHDRTPKAHVHGTHVRHG
jgi:hypothetical protein